MDSGAPALTDELATFLASGLSILVGTRDASLRPTALRAGGAKATADRRHIEIALPTVTSARTIANLRENGRIAVTFSRPSDYRSVQIKGRCIDIQDTPASERARLEAYRDAFTADLELVGLARENTLRLAVWPAITITMTVETMFDQAPGPQAGRPYEAPAT